MTIYSKADIGLEKNVERETVWERSLFPIRKAEQTVTYETRHAGFCLPSPLFGPIERGGLVQKGLSRRALRKTRDE